MKQERIYTATFVMFVIVMIACVATAVMNYQMYLSRAELFLRFDDLQQRIDEVERKQDTNNMRHCVALEL